MRLADVIDLEARLLADEEAAPEALRTRDRAVAARLDPAADDRSLLRAWLAALREGPGPSPGEQVAQARSLLGFGLVVLGLAAGFAAASAALAYDGRHPVNALTFLWVFVFAPILLLVFVLLSLALRRSLPGLARGVPGVGLLRAATAWLASVALRAVERLRRERRTGALDEAGRVLRQVRRRGVLWRPLERWSLLAAMQAFAVAFFAAALTRVLLLVAFSDIAFAWSTTLQVGPETLHDVVSALAAPWRWALPDAAPSEELVALTRYSRLEAAYLAAAGGRAPDPLVIGGWWPFLFVATAVYGLLPRLALWIAAQVLLRRALRRLPLDTPDVQRVLRRLRYPVVETDPTSAAAPLRPRLAEVAAPAAPATPTAGPAPADAAQACALVVWRDAPVDDALRQEVEARLRWPVRRVLSAGGADYGEEQATIVALGAAGGAEAVLVVAEPFEAPDRAFLRFLRATRQAVGPRRPIVVALAGAAAGPAGGDVVQLWREGLAALGDPYLDLEPLEAA